MLIMLEVVGIDGECVDGEWMNVLVIPWVDGRNNCWMSGLVDEEIVGG